MRPLETERKFLQRERKEDASVAIEIGARVVVIVSVALLLALTGVALVRLAVRGAAAREPEPDVGPPAAAAERVAVTA